MKRFLSAMLVLAAITVACTPEDSKVSPAVSFATALPVTADDAATFTIAVADYTGTDAVTIPVIFGGDAVKGEDYTVSAEAFVYGGESPVTAITVTSLKYGTGKKVSLTLDVPEGWIAGKYPVSEWELSDKIGYATFQSNRQIMTTSVSVTVEIYDDKGSLKKLENGAELSVSVNTEESTAVEGTDFTFANDSKTVSIAAGSNKGTITLNLVGDVPAEGRDKIVLNLEPGGKFDLGNYAKTTINIAGSAWSKFGGEWVLNEFVTDYDYMMNMWYDENLVGALFPKANEGDSFTIDLESASFIPEFTSDLKNYFIGVSNITKSDEYMIRVGMGDKIYLEMLELDNTNRNFSATSQSEDKVSLLGVRIITDEETQEEFLDMYILDFVATDFFIGFSEWAAYNETKPTATMDGVFLNLTFKRAE